VVAVAGEANGRLAPTPVAEALREAARQIGVRLIDVEKGPPDDAPQILLLELGTLDTSSLQRLSEPLDPGLDLLLWTWPGAGAQKVRSQYVLGLWAWSLGVETVRCLVDECDDPRELAQRVGEDLRHTEWSGACEILEHPGEPKRQAALYTQILQSLLSAPPRRARASA
jgi:hypothetical protein